MIPPSVVGVDVVYLSYEMVARQRDDTTLISGPPLLAVEVLSPSDKQEEINEKVDEYLATGVELVWIVDPHFRTVLVHQPGLAPKLFNVEERLGGYPQLPGFDVAVAEVFA